MSYDLIAWPSTVVRPYKSKPYRVLKWRIHEDGKPITTLQGHGTLSRWGSKYVEHPDETAMRGKLQRALPDHEVVSIPDVHHLGMALYEARQHIPLQTLTAPAVLNTTTTTASPAMRGAVIVETDLSLFFQGEDGEKE